MGADILFLVFVLYGLVFGLRRGFYKELIAFCAIFIAVGAARTWRDPAGRLIESKLSFIGTSVAHVLGAIVVWIVAFLLVTLVGRLLLKKLRDPDRENNLEKVAEGGADVAEGKDEEGPVTLLTNPIAKAHKSFVYWSDKLLGGLLGVAKGAAAAYALFAVVYFVDLHLGNMGAVKESITKSRAALIYQQFLVDQLRKFPEYRVVENAAKTEQLAELTKGDPKLIDRLAQHPEWSALKATDAWKTLAADVDMQVAWGKTEADGKRDLKTLLKMPKVRKLLTDPAFHEAFADVKLDSVIDAIEHPVPPP